MLRLLWGHGFFVTFAVKEEDIVWASVIYKNLTLLPIDYTATLTTKTENTMQDMTKLADRDLVVAYANDSNEAFDILLERHKDRTNVQKCT